MDFLTFKTHRRHRCPHNPNPRVLDGPCAFSEYTEVYKPYDIQPRVSFKPNTEAKLSSDPLDDQTIHKYVVIILLNNYYINCMKQFLISKQASFMHFKLNSSKFNFIYLSRSKSLTSFFSPVRISDLTIYPSSTIFSFSFFLDSYFFLNLKFFLLLLLVFFTYVASDRSLLISMLLLSRFLSALLFSLDLITATLCTIIFLNLLSTL